MWHFEELRLFLLVPESTSSSKAPPSSKVQRKNGAKVADKSANPDVSSDNARVQHEHTLELQQENEVECISKKISHILHKFSSRSKAVNNNSGNQENISEETIPSTNTNPPSAVDGSSSTFADAINTPMPISVPPPPPITPICRFFLFFSCITILTTNFYRRA